MEDTLFSLRLVLLFMPGLVATLTLDRMTPGERPSSFYFVAYSLVLGLISYIAWFIISRPLNFLSGKLGIATPPYSFTDYLFDEKLPINYGQLAATTILAIGIGGLVAYLVNSNAPFRLMRKLGITVQTGLDGIWTYLHQQMKGSDWVYLRDRSTGRTYKGTVALWSDSAGDKELVLSQVKVFRRNGELAYEVPAAYFVLNTETQHLELPNLEIERVPDVSQRDDALGEESARSPRT